MAGPPRIGVFGGTFDPIHLGHLIVATELRHALRLDRLLFVPAGRPPHKRGAEVANDRHRLAMVRLAVAGNPAFEVSSVDLVPGKASFTVDLLERLRDDLTPVSLVFLMGEDSLRDLPRWREPGRIAALAEFGVATRPGIAVDLEAVVAAVPEARGRIHLVPTPLIEIASRDLQRRVATGAPIGYQVTPAVERYIREHGLYRGGLTPGGR